MPVTVKEVDLLDISPLNYVLARINLVRAGCPRELTQTVSNQVPHLAIVIQANRQKLGLVPSTGYFPPGVIVAGAARRSRLLSEGIVQSWAMIERRAVGSMQIKAADDVVGYKELLQGIQAALNEKLYGSNHNGNNPLPTQACAWVKEVYPFENLFTFQLKGKKYRQAYALSADRSLVLDGKAIDIEAGLIPRIGRTEVAEPLQNQNGAMFFPAAPQDLPHWTTTGGRNSELVSQLVRNWSNILEAVNMYLNAGKHGLHKPLRPAFAPVSLSDDGKVQKGLVAKGIDPFDFAMWSADAKQKKTKAVGGDQVPRSKFAYVGDPNDPSTWHLPTDTPGRARASLARVNQTQGIPADAKPAVLQKIRRAAEHHGIEVTEKPTPGQKDWAKHKVAAEARA